MILEHELYGRGREGVVVMHDFYGCKHTWDFARNFFDVENFTYAFTELRGYGNSRRITGEYTPEEAAADAIAVADNMGWERFHIVGHSMSGMVAQRVAVDGGDRIKSVVLNTPVHASGLKFAPGGFEMISDSLHDDDILSQAFDALTGGRLCKEWLAFKSRQTRENRTREAQAAYLVNCRDRGFQDLAEGNETPMLIIVGEHDIEPFRKEDIEASLLKWYPNAEMVICGNAGHYPQQEAPVFVATVMNEFLSRQL
ncbi:MAG: alpha/beta fold hydrolase [Gammaproteobacteria bacterium]